MTEDATKLRPSAGASDLYEVKHWGKGGFSASEKGHLYVHPERKSFRSIDLIHRLQTAVETAAGKGSIDHEEAGRFVRFYEDSLNSYTYLETPHENVVDPASCEIELEGPVAR